MSDSVTSDAARLSKSTDTHIYTLGAVLGACAGILDVKIGDLLLTALFVLASAMLLGALRPQKPWRWTITIAVFVPVVQLLAYFFLTEKPYAAQIYESFLGFLTGIAGAYGGSFFRRGLNEILKQ
jgi:ABC-type multidrug transport system permease subunit